MVQEVRLADFVSFLEEVCEGDAARTVGARQSREDLSVGAVVPGQPPGCLVERRLWMQVYGRQVGADRFGDAVGQARHQLLLGQTLGHQCARPGQGAHQRRWRLSVGDLWLAWICFAHLRSRISWPPAYGRVW